MPISRKYQTRHFPTNICVHYPPLAKSKYVSRSPAHILPYIISNSFVTKPKKQPTKISSLIPCLISYVINQQLGMHLMRVNYVQEKVETVDGTCKVKRYKLLEEIGEGSFSKCWKVNTVGTDKIYAMKILPKKNMQFLEQEKLVSEIRIHQSLSHPHIVFLEHSFEDYNNQYIFLEYCQNGTLDNRSPKFESLDEKQIRYYGQQIISALKYLHQKRILHRDLKLTNCFLNSQNQIKIGDFGFACKLQCDQQLKRQTCGTPNFLSPEVAGGFGHSFPSDVWSFGVILFRLKYGICPFESESLHETVRRIKTADYTFSKWVGISPELKDLIQKILVIDYDSRLTIDEIEAHPFFVGEGGPQGELKKTTSLKNFISRLFSRDKRGEVDNSLCKVDSCKNLKQIKTILRDKTQEKEYSNRDSTIKDDKRMKSNNSSKMSTMNTMRGVISSRYDQATSSYYGKAPQPKPSKVLVSKPRSNQPSVTQFFPHFLIYSVQVYDQCLILYLTNGLRQIFKDRQIYLVFSGSHVVDRTGVQLTQLPRLVDYICRQKMKQSTYKPSEQTFKEQVNRRNFITKWKTVEREKMFTLNNATVLTTSGKNTYYIKSDYCECLYNSRLEIVVNESLLAKCKLAMLEMYVPQQQPANRQRKFLE